MDEMETYRNRIYKDRRKTPRGTNRRQRGHTPPFWTIGLVVQLITLILTGLLMIILSGCAYIKKTFLGG